MKSVWRIEVPIGDKLVMCLPHLLRLVHVARSRSREHGAELWYEVDTEQQSARELWVWFEGTGHPIDHDGAYLGTIMTDCGALVWHTYWKIES